MASIYTDTSLYANNKLGMVNQCLLSIGQRPLAEGTLLENLPLGSDGRIASDIVSNVMKEIQSKGWYFNTDLDYIFIPDSTNFIIVPPTLLRVDAGRSADRGIFILKGNRFYNRKTRDYTFTHSIKADAVWLMDYEQLPFLAFQYIALRAARLFQQKVLGATELTSATMREEEEALISFTREDMQYNDYNLVPKSILIRR
ncbi:MAG: hypothetical protein JHC33_07690 [Ignisphaera sp.]|nr:hypothetical protein [Ignisphaera sp.]